MELIKIIELQFPFQQKNQKFKSLLMASKLSMKNLHTFGVEHISDSDRSSSLKSQINTLPNPYLADTKRIFNPNKAAKPKAQYQLSPNFNAQKRNASRIKSKQLTQQISQIARQAKNTERPYPHNSIIYLLKNESECIQRLKQNIQYDKQKLSDQFIDFNKTICNIMDDLKCTILAELDSQYQKFVDKFRIMKVEYKNYCNIKNQFWSMRAGEIEKVQKNTYLMPGENFRYPGMVNKQDIDNQLLLLNFIEDLKECKKHVNYKQFTEIQQKLLKPLLFTADCLVKQLNIDSYFQPNATNKTFQNLRGYFEKQVHKLYDKMDNFMKSHTKIVQPESLRKEQYNFPLQSKLVQKNQYNSKADKRIQGNTFVLKERQKKQAVQGQIYMKRKEKSPLQQITNQQFEHQMLYNLVQNQSKKPTSTAFSCEYNENLKSAFDFMQKENQRQKSTYSDKCMNDKNNCFTQSQKHQEKLKSTKSNFSYNQFRLEQDRMIVDKNPSKAKQQISQTALCVKYLGFNKLAVGTKSGVVKLFCTKTSSKLGEFHGHQSAICSLSSIQMNNNVYLISGGDIGCCQIICWNSSSFGIHHKFTNEHKAAVTCILDLADGSNFISGSFDCSINLLSLKKKELIKSIKTGQKIISITKVKGKKNENCIITGNLNSQISVWKLIRNTFNSLIGLQSIRNVSVGTYPYSIIEFSSHLSQSGLVMVAGKDRWVRIVNFEKGTIEKASQLGQFCQLLKIESFDKQEAIIGVQSNGKLQRILQNTSGYPQEQLQSYQIGDFSGLTYSCGIAPKHAIIKEKNAQSILMIPNHKSRQSEVKIWKIKEKKRSESGSNLYTY